MKKLITFLAVAAITTISHGANPYMITFKGAGAGLQKVHVENITKGTTVEMNATDVLQLVLVTKVDNINANAETLMVYPNPMNQSCNIHFNNENTENVGIKIIDMSGKVIFNYNRLLAGGDHDFILSGLTAGIYVINVKTTNKNYTNKIISTNLTKTMLDFEEISSTNQQNASTEKAMQKIKSVQTATIDMQYSTGDQLKFVGYATGFANNTIYASPTATTAYTFSFVAPYYRITGNTVASSQPCFVDIMFSISDVNFKGVDNLANADFVVKENSVVVSPSESFRYIKSINTVPNVIKTVIMIDNSSSIGNKLSQIKTAALGMINNIGKNQEIAIYSFSDAPTLLQNFTNDVSKLTAAVNSIALGYPSTNLYGSYITGVSAWQDTYSINLIQKGFLVLFTDGDDTQASSTIAQALAARGQKSTYIIGLGADIVPATLNQLANPSPYYAASSVAELEQIFVNIQKDIYKFANSFYWLNYMTPKRGSTHTLKIELKNNTNVATDASYQGSFSAAGFQSVLSGAYINIENTKLYGLDTIRCFYSTAGYSFTYDKAGTSQYAKDSLVLKPVTYWATNQPVYSWVNLKNTTNTLKKSTYSNVTLFPLSTVSDTTKITLTDEANKTLGDKYTNNLVLVVYSDFAGVTTASPTDITSTTGTMGGEVKSIGNSAVTSRVVCWSKTPIPTTANSKVAVGSGKGVFNTNITGLVGGTKYYVRAYATNNAGTSYGNEVSFTTSGAVVPTLTTTTINNITQTSASSGGSIISDGGTTITTRGVCWNTSSNPTVTLTTKTSDGTGTGSFTSSITGLTVGNIYYVRAYATNNVGTAYGAEVSFTNTLPTITTTAVSAITATSASSGGNVTAIGGAAVTARGVCWSTTTSPTIALTTKTSDGTGISTFTSAITGLTTGTTYYVRAYATNSIGTVYGAEVSFTSLAVPTLAATTAASSITAISATCGGNITTNGGATVTARGVCWSISANPTVALTTKTSDGTGSGVFTSTITGLTANATYYVRAYATNSVGTVYGTQVSFITMNGTSTLTTAAASSITAISASSGGNITADGGAAITARGVCWSSSINPTIALTTKTSDGTGIGSFASAITGLTIGTTYYVRAYATNSVGSVYGTQVSFSTTLPTVTTTAMSAITATAASSGGNVTAIGGADVTARGVCWSTSANPTVALTTKTSDGTGIGTFTSAITGIITGTIYYVRAYATNSVGTAYGTEISFTTLALPTLSTTAASSITSSSASSGGVITADYGATVTVRGICWSTNTNPTVALTTKTADGTGIGTFTSTITGLTIGNVYYIRAYATNSLGTAYGGEVSFSTTLPTVTTEVTITNIAATAATSGGNVIAIGGADVTARGTCWSTSTNPTIALTTKTSDGTGIGAFTSAITGLAASTKYYVKAYATNSVGAVYGAEVSFTTAVKTTPAITSSTITNITATTATGGGIIANDGGAPVTARGVCWSTNPNPTIALTTKTSDGTGIGTFTSAISGLTLGTMYYLRAYATNSLGTVYGAHKYFNTILPTVTTSTASTITATSATSGGVLNNQGGALVTAQGVCWSTSTNPTIALTTKTSDGIDFNSFTSAITGLAASTKYYVKAYATNSIGTGYGAEVTFTTAVKTIPTITSSTVDNITGTSASSGGNITDDGGVAITARGVCWSTSANPTVALTTKTTDGTGIGAFTSAISGLANGATFYIRAYTTNSAGTAYGSEVSFTTLGIPTLAATTAVSSITATTASSGGNITSDGGATITARGVCWSTSTNPTIALTTKTVDGAGLGRFISSITNLATGNTYYVRAYATNSVGTAYGTQAIFTLPTSYSIGTSYLGGKIAYVDGSGIHGFVCALEDQSTGVKWRNISNITIGATNCLLETNGVYGITKSCGRKNTDAIIAMQGVGTYAASICTVLTTGGAEPGDWYLPSKNELNKLYINKTILGLFSVKYWSSSEHDNNAFVWAQDFTSGTQNGYGKEGLHSVRAIRAF